MGTVVVNEHEANIYPDILICSMQSTEYITTLVLTSSPNGEQCDLPYYMARDAQKIYQKLGLI